MKYIIPLDVEVDLGEGVMFDADQVDALLLTLGDDITDALCCHAGSVVEVDLANAENNASREWYLNLDWGHRGQFDPEPPDVPRGTSSAAGSPGDET